VVIVFDFDGTLVSRDSFLDFSRRYCFARPARLLLIALLLPLSLLVALRSRRHAGSILLWAMTVGGSTRAFVLALRRYARDALPSYANEFVFSELSRHVRAGARVVIATGSHPLLVRGLFEARKFARLPIVGSRFRSRFGGLVAETHCVGRIKVRELERKLSIREWSALYTDSFADRSLMRGAREITLISPNRRTERLTRRLIARETALRVLRSS
jgi:phosphatidylglycerophosphatase C